MRSRNPDLISQFQLAMEFMELNCTFSITSCSHVRKQSGSAPHLNFCFGCTVMPNYVVAFHGPSLYRVGYSNRSRPTNNNNKRLLTGLLLGRASIKLKASGELLSIRCPIRTELLRALTGNGNFFVDDYLFRFDVEEKASFSCVDPLFPWSYII